MKNALTIQQTKSLITDKLSHYFGVSPETASDEQFYNAVSMIIRDKMAEMNVAFKKAAANQDSKKIYYLSMEFLMGRSLKNNMYNLGYIDVFEKALKSMDVKLDNLFEIERDAGLGNGGLGRLAACYLDGLATNGFQSMGYSLKYEAGIFKQKLADGWQTELPDLWLPSGEVWLVPRNERAREIYFGGHIEESWDGDYHHIEHVDANVITAVPCDMYVSGKGEGISRLRLWSAKKPEFDYEAFRRGLYVQALEESAMAAAISKVLYPDDQTPEGKSLRLRQQYFLVSASVQDIIQRHLTEYGTLDNLPEKIAIHVNDTHPTMVIPELMRIMLDECGYDWDKAWSIVTRTVAYTNHTVMKEALECWSEELYSRLLPRIYQITKEIDNRFRAYIWSATGDADRVERMAIISGGNVRMANLCVAGSHSVNGVSALHSEILKDTIFKDFYMLTPESSAMLQTVLLSEDGFARQTRSLPNISRSLSATNSSPSRMSFLSFAISRMIKRFLQNSPRLSTKTRFALQQLLKREWALKSTPIQFLTYRLNDFTNISASSLTFLISYLNTRCSRAIRMLITIQRPISLRQRQHRATLWQRSLFSLLTRFQML